MGAGIYVLIGLAAGSAGPGVWLSYLVCGLLSLLSVVVFGELSRRVPVSGGGYAFAYSALGSFWGFMTGWLLALGSIFACYKIELASSDTPLDFLVERSSDFDLLIVGATKVGLLERAVIGPFSSQIALRSHCSVAVVRVAQAVERLGKSIIRRK